jgi:hypothetical protein
MPDDGLKGLGMRRHEAGIDGRDDDDMVTDSLGIAAVAADHAADHQAARLGFLQGEEEIGADLALGVAAADLEDQHRVRGIRLAGAQPGGEDGIPALVISARGQLRHVVSRGIGLDAA